MIAMARQNDGRRRRGSEDHSLARVARRFVAIGLTATVLVTLLPGCGGNDPRTVRLGTYVSQLCEAIGPFERDSQTFGRVLVKYTLRLKSRESEQRVASALTPVIADSRHVVVAMQAVGAPDIHDGRALAAAVRRAFSKILESDVTWRAELRTGVWAWPTMSRAKRERVRTSLEALIQVGREFEALPHSPETQDAMAHSPVCREVFGAVPAARRRTAAGSAGVGGTP